MKSGKKVKSSCSDSDSDLEVDYLPPEVWTRIFESLPVKSLLRCRCVSKSWQSIIDDPDFITRHLNLCRVNNKLLLVTESIIPRGRRSGYIQMITLRRADTLRLSADISSTLAIESHYLYGRNCDGMYLVRSVGNYEEMRIWNPSIRKSLILPRCPFPLPILADSICALGFALQAKDYKVILVKPGSNHFKGTNMLMNVAVYTLSDQQWRVSNKPGLRISHVYFSRIFRRATTPWCHYFQGGAHWLGYLPDAEFTRVNPTHLVSLDFDSEEFSFLEMPYTSSEKRESVWYMFNLRESLAVLCISSVCCSIWVLRQESGIMRGKPKGVWSLWFSGESSRGGFSLFKKNRPEDPLVFYYESGVGGRSRYLRLGDRSYNIDTCAVLKHDKSKRMYHKLDSYSESLVLLKG